MSFNEGDFVKIDYTARRTTDNSLVLTTIQNVAKENNFENGRYEPRLVIIGKGLISKGVETAIKGMNVNETKKVVIQPKDGFGDRNEALVSVMHLAGFRAKGIDPQPGMQINIDGTLALVKSVSSGRVVVDMNHQLAGEILSYEIKVVEKIDAEKDKVKAIAEFYGVKPENASVESGNAKIAVGSKVNKDADYFLNKAGFVGGVFKFMPSIKKVFVDEEYSKEEIEKAK